mmetsp:Transcript_16856/g.32035  ORF Transcript_16856/g.32035 Transcript_16856/m.32035 type:complete len:290 (+) Transcript_16856:86-955(+)|eukprot:scaffold2715_cov170-Amphora_coffeaeformis.AAC.2
MKSILVSESSPLDGWLPFFQDELRQSFAYVLPFDVHQTTHWTTYNQLDAWFDALHLSQHCAPTHSTVDHKAWVPVTYRGQTLLRQTAWVTFDDDCTCAYGYSDMWQSQSTSTEFKRIVQEITHYVQDATGVTFNACNLNYYPPGAGVGFHADDEFLFDGLNRETCIVSLSLCRGLDDGLLAGARKFLVKPKQRDHQNNNINHAKYHPDELVLKHGDLVTMEGMFQKHYLHSIWPGDSLQKFHENDPFCQGERINLTWRTIVQHLDGSDDQCRGKLCPVSKIKVSFDPTS